MTLTPRGFRARGFALPAVLVISAAMLVLAVGLLALVGIESKTARSFSDAKRAELAARAGMEQFRSILRKETANDDFLVVADLPDKARDGTKLPLQNLYVARGQGGGDNVSYRYQPLFSSATQPASTPLQTPPKAEDLIGKSVKEFGTVPGFDTARASWITIKDDKNNDVARYAYWVEDLQGKVDVMTAGNQDGDAGQPGRGKYPFPAVGMNPLPLSDKEPRLNQVALNILDPQQTGETPSGDLTKKLIENRPVMVSPQSLLAGAEIPAPLPRDKKSGLYVNTLADSLDRNATPAIEPYKERPTVPFARGIDAAAAGQPKMNLNRLLAEDRDKAVTEFAQWIKTGLPRFADRKGGFPDKDLLEDPRFPYPHTEDYLMTLGAEAMDYADADSTPTIKEGVYRGLDAYPLLSEIAVQINYTGSTTENGQRFLNFRNRLFVEVWNMTNLPVAGNARFSYEIGLPFDGGIGALPAATRGFDDPSMMSKATHNLTQENGKFWSPDIAVSLKPDEYRFYEVADVKYKIPAGDASENIGNTFKLTEHEDGGDDAGAHPYGRGLALKWNGQQVDYVQRIKHIDSQFATDAAQFIFTVKTPKTVGKGAIPGQSYKSVGNYVDDMGDPRISYYLRHVPLDENAYPDNLSPNRRNIRQKTIYSGDTKTKPLFYGRVQPSEWPDGGHDSSAGTWAAQTDETVIPTDTKIYPIPAMPADSYKTAPQRISNAGRFYSATELGRLFDPILWTQRYDNNSDDAVFNSAGKPQLPASQHWMPEVLLKAEPRPDSGGGNTLRIGRPEHPRFDYPGLRAANLLDLFHAGESTSENAADREGDLVTVAGAVNLNTASRDAIRALAAGILGQDPAIGRVTSWNHDATKKAPPVTELSTVGSPTRSGGATTTPADRVADAIILCRPYASAGELTAATEVKRNPAPGNTTDVNAVFGNRKMYVYGDNLQWNDSAAEEVFDRVFEASTFRSRNFRVWVVGQALGATTSGSTEPQVLAESRKVYTIFADPGTRQGDGSINANTYRPRGP